MQTYRQLLEELKNLSEEQLDYEVTIELEYDDEYLPAKLRICDEEHQVLDNEFPVIFAL